MISTVTNTKKYSLMPYQIIKSVPAAFEHLDTQRS